MRVIAKAHAAAEWESLGWTSLGRTSVSNNRSQPSPAPNAKGCILGAPERVRSISVQFAPEHPITPAISKWLNR